MRQLSELPSKADVVIIGAGIVGCATAFFVSRAGRSPLVIERADSIAAATTSVSAHAIRCQFTEPENIAQMSESLDMYEHFRDLVGDPSAQIDLIQNGYLFASTEESDIGAFSDRVDRQHQLGVTDVELLTGEEIRYRFPWMSPSIVVGAFRARDGWIDSALAADHFLTASNAPTLLNTNVVSIDITDGAVTGVMTDRGSIRCSAVVLAAGPYSRDICPEPLPVAASHRPRRG